MFKVNLSTLIDWKRRYEATGDVKPKVRAVRSTRKLFLKTRPHGQRGVPEKKVLQNIAGKYLQTLIFSAAVFAGIPPIELSRSVLKRKIAG